MPAMNPAINTIAAVSRDPSFAKATISLDTSKWSGRRRNIVLRALRDGVTNCGHDTAQFIKHLTDGYGVTVQTASKWCPTIDLAAVKPEEVDNLIAYTAAWIKMETAQKDIYHGYTWYYRHFLHAIQNGEKPDEVPLPSNLSDRQKTDFIKQYLRDDDETKGVRQQLADKINNGETITLTVDAIHKE